MNSATDPVGGIVVINLDTRTDRWAAFEQEVSPLFPNFPISRLSAVHGITLEGYGQRPWFRGRERDRTWAGRAGCVLSHRKALELALESDWEFVLILEDDVEAVADVQKLFPEVLKQLHRVQWGACYLGYTNPRGPARTLGSVSESLTLQQVYACSSTHAFLVRGVEIKRLLAYLPTEEDVWLWLSRHRAIDAWYSRHLSKVMTVLALNQSIMVQKQSPSDITGRSFEPPHLTCIPPSLVLARGFDWRFKWSSVIASAGAFFDRLKAIIKQLRGF